jgi:hypothetical protein
VELGFVLLFMTCDGHTNAECYWHSKAFPTKHECVQAMGQEEEWSFLGSSGKRFVYNQLQAMCLREDVVALPSNMRTRK